MSAICTIAKADFAHALRSRYVWIGIAFVTGLVALDWYSVSSAFPRTPDPISVVLEPFVVLTPLIAIGIGYAALVSERSSGRVRVILGLPGTRRDLLFGKYLSRLLVLVVALMASMTVLSVLIVAWASGVSFIALFGSMLLVVLYGSAWLGIALGVSGSVSTELRSISILGGAFVFFGVLWDQVAVPLLSLAFTGSTNPATLPGFRTPLAFAETPVWYLYGTRLSPVESFRAARYYVPETLDALATGSAVTAPHLPNLFGLLVLFAWAVVPIAISRRRFRQVDLV